MQRGHVLFRLRAKMQAPCSVKTVARHTLESKRLSCRPIGDALRGTTRGCEKNDLHSEKGHGRVRVLATIVVSDNLSPRFMQPFVSCTGPVLINRLTCSVSCGSCVRQPPPLSSASSEQRVHHQEMGNLLAGPKPSNPRCDQKQPGSTYTPTSKWAANGSQPQAALSCGQCMPRRTHARMRCWCTCAPATPSTQHQGHNHGP